MSEEGGGGGLGDASAEKQDDAFRRTSSTRLATKQTERSSCGAASTRSRTIPGPAIAGSGSGMHGSAFKW
tara:strand:+ start:1509 stop:1718 length:210 start_codon:yes stop_codon:yes gene_type:complete